MSIDDLKKINNYVVLSLTRIMKEENRPNELIHVSALRIENDTPVECIDVYVQNSKKKYNAGKNKNALPFLLVISLLKDWLEKKIIIIHENGRNDINWLYEEMQKHFSISFDNEYINIEEVAKSIFKLKRTSLKNIALHFNICPKNNKYDSKSKDTMNCYLIYKIWNEIKNI